MVARGGARWGDLAPCARTCAGAEARSVAAAAEAAGWWPVARAAGSASEAPAQRPGGGLVRACAASAAAGVAGAAGARQGSDTAAALAQRCVSLAAVASSCPSPTVVVACPATERELEHACASAPCDTVALPLERRLPFALRRDRVAAALARGVLFELPYAPLTRPPSEARRQFVANARALLWAARGGRGGGVVLVGGCRRKGEVRSPREAAALVRATLGVGPRALAAMRAAAEALPSKAARRRRAVSKVGDRQQAVFFAHVASPREP